MHETSDEPTPHCTLERHATCSRPRAAAAPTAAGKGERRRAGGRARAGRQRPISLLRHPRAALAAAAVAFGVLPSPPPLQQQQQPSLPQQPPPFSWISALLPHFPAAEAYSVYEDEYLNGQLPGHPDDARGLPNLPFTVDTSRASDGISSVSPFTTTSPSFPLYPASSNYEKYGVTPASELQARKDHHARLEDSRRLQGLAKPDAGEAEREAAAYHRLSAIGSRGDVLLPSTTFPVDAAKRWNPSAFAIERYETYRIEVPGDQRWVDGTIETSANGYTSRYDAVSKCYVAAGRCRPHLKTRKRLVDQGAKWLQLVCGVGDYVRLLQRVSQNDHRLMPLREDAFGAETLFQVGKGVTVNASLSGELVCFANDADTLYANNKGLLNVTVTRVSWPPLKGGEVVTTESGQNATRWPLRYRWPPAPYLEIVDYKGPLNV